MIYIFLFSDGRRLRGCEREGLWGERRRFSGKKKCGPFTRLELFSGLFSPLPPLKLLSERGNSKHALPRAGGNIGDSQGEKEGVSENGPRAPNFPMRLKWGEGSYVGRKVGRREWSQPCHPTQRRGKRRGRGGGGKT